MRLLVKRFVQSETGTIDDTGVSKNKRNQKRFMKIYAPPGTDAEGELWPLEESNKRC